MEKKKTEKTAMFVSFSSPNTSDKKNENFEPPQKVLCAPPAYPQAVPQLRGALIANAVAVEVKYLQIGDMLSTAHTQKAHAGGGERGSARTGNGTGYMAHAWTLKHCYLAGTCTHLHTQTH